jgi:hypothetical protein
MGEPTPRLITQGLENSSNKSVRGVRIPKRRVGASAAKRAGVWNSPYMDAAPIGKRDDQPAM